MPKPASPITDALITAAQTGEVHAIVTYLESGGDINGRSASGSTLLIEAARAGQSEVVGFLLSQKASVTPRDSTGAAALHVAAVNGHTAVVEALIEAHQAQRKLVDVKNKLGKTPLFYASKNKHSDIVFRLLENGANIFNTTETCSSVLHIAAKTGDAAFITAILNYYKTHALDIDRQNTLGHTPLMFAILSGNLEAVKVFIQAGANPYFMGMLKYSDRIATKCTALHVAAMYGKDDIAEYLVDYILRNHQSIDPVSPELGTPLMIWAGKDNLAIVRKLIENDAYILECDDSQKMVLHAAADSGATKVLGYLLEYCQYNNIDVVNARSTAWVTPLMSAAFHGHQKAFDLLLKYGADLNLRDRLGWTILAQAVSSKSPDFLRHVIREYRKNEMSIDELFDGDTALSLAIFSIDAIDQVTVLLEEGAQRGFTFEDGETIIHRAARAGKTEVLDALLTVNLSHEGRRALIDSGDSAEKSPLVYAAEGNNPAAIELLLSYDADIEKRSDFGLVPLHYAAEGHPEATKALLDAGANPNCLSNIGLKPMTFALRAYDLACAKLLVQHGALLNNAPYIAGALRRASAEHYPQSDAMFHFLHSQGAMIPAVAPGFPLRPGTMERLAPLRQQDAPYAAAIASGPAAVRALLETPGLRPLRWRDTRMAKHANNGTYELLLAKARADERLALYQGSQRVFVSYIADRIQEANQYYKGEEEKKVVPCNLDVLIMICGLNKKHLPQYPHLTKEDIEDVQKAVLSRLKSNAETLAKWRAIQAHMADSENEEYKIFRGAPEKIAELKARAAAESQRGDASRALLFSDSGKRGAASRPRAAAAGRPAKQAKAMAEVDSSEEAPKGKRAKRKLS